METNQTTDFVQMREQAKIEGVSNEYNGRVYPLKKRADCTPEELEYQERVWTAQNGVTSERKKLAGKLKGIKMTKNPEEIQRKSMELINDPKAHALSIIQLQQFLIESEVLTDRDKINLLKALTSVHTALFPISTNIVIKSTFESDLAKFNSEYFRLREAKAEAEAKTKIKEEEKNGEQVSETES
jgi:hypothetical protein